jgi:hypothetical protein
MAQQKSPSDSGKTDNITKPKSKRAAPLSQMDVPAYTLNDAMRVPKTIRDEFAKSPTTPLDLAVGLDMSPTGGPYKMLTGSAIAYGLTEGGAQASQISLTPLGRRAVAPEVEGDDAAALRDAVLKPRVVREFLERYNGSPLPSTTIAKNVLESLGVPASATEKAYDMILRNAEDHGLLANIKDKKYVRLVPTVLPASKVDDLTGEESGPLVEPDSTGSPEGEGGVSSEPTAPPTVEASNNRVFITHGKNTKVVEQIKKILTFGKFDAVQSTAQQSVAKPVPDKVMDDMRSCNAAIVHVGAEKQLIDDDGTEHTIINPNVLIEIGAAMALYGRRFVLLVERGVELPSNLQGLYEVRYEGEQLDHDATMRLLEAFNGFR